ncbi:hypothetical protein [Cohnella silvisoli]|uniref:CopG family transcriptional regulator n=1 Tax=Cohnella silvisoli TaxID=2873699 RepID=A0ABV1KLU0_9BACL|nr:hypothetical protein [Cohnella silvisoli]MCD9020860.1 hypothetical protein [Cohnella silvisoli]
MRKLKEQQIELLKLIIDDGDTTFEIDGTKYEICVIAENDIFRTSVVEDMESNSELKDVLIQAKKDIKEGNYYSSEEMKDMIRRGEA